MEDAGVAHIVVLYIEPVLNELVTMTQLALDEEVSDDATKTARQVILHLQ